MNDNRNRVSIFWIVLALVFLLGKSHFFAKKHGEISPGAIRSDSIKALIFYELT